MSLQRRLTLVFSLIVMLPLAVAGFVVQRVVVDEIERRAVESLSPALNATVALYNERLGGLVPRVRDAVGHPRFGEMLAARRVDEIERFLSAKLFEAGGLDFLVALDENGGVLASSLGDSSFSTSFRPPTPSDILAAESGIGPGFTRTPPLEIRPRGGDAVGTVVGGFWLDDDVMAVSPQSEVQLSIVSDSRVIASTRDTAGDTSVDPVFGRAFEADIEGGAIAQARDLAGGQVLVAWTPRSPLVARERQVITWMVALLLLAGVATAVLARRLARLTTQDLEELTEGARAIAEGNFDKEIPIRTKDEIGVLAAAFNDMRVQLSGTMSELQESRDKIQLAIRRVGETLRSTHDMKSILEAMMNTAADAIDADAALLWRFSPTREELYPALGRGIDVDEQLRLRVGEGIVGIVAERGITLRLPNGSGPRHSLAEPDLPVTMALPLYTDDRIAAVMALYRRDEARPFSPADLDTATFLAEPGGVAMENVALQEETRRLSLTDGLTGVWNRRYLQMQFRRDLATAERYERPFSVLMLDLDFFKQVNDTYGHQRGDAVLIEFSRRVHRLLREVDTFARYGGEEFVCLLSETNVQGAMTTAEKIVDSVHSDPFGSSGEVPIELSVSIGVAAYPDHGDSARVLIDSADKALYKAKQQGRDRVCVADGPSEPPGDSPLKIAK